MLVIMKYRYLQLAFEFFLDLETTRRADIFEVNRPKPGCNPARGENDFLGVSSVQANGISVDVGKFLEQHRFAFHDRHGSRRSDIAQTKHGRSVADDGHRIFLDGQFAVTMRFLGDGHADPGHAWRVRHR